jgi:hypothetical protein
MSGYGVKTRVQGRVAAAACWECHVEEKLLGASAGTIARPVWKDAIAGNKTSNNSNLLFASIKDEVFTRKLVVLLSLAKNKLLLENKIPLWVDVITNIVTCLAN